MKILHVVEDYSIESGGLRTVIKNLNYYLNKAGFVSHILSSKQESLDNIFIVETNKPWLYSSEWLDKLTAIHKEFNFDVIHIHGVWTYPQYKAAKFSIKNKIPFILSCHGMYEPWLWKKGTLKKKLYFNNVVKNVFKKASFIHAITPGERSNLIDLFNNNKIVEIPNLISNVKNVKTTNQNKEKYIFYLGRLDSKKGIDILINAFAEIKHDDVKLIIAGKINNYKESLDILISSLGISSKVKFLGLITGDKKQNLIKNAHVLVAPSHSEVIGMVNLEAGILKTPVITTYQTGLNLDWNNNGGKLINPNTKELIKALDEVLNWNSEERKLNGEKLYNFVVNNYSWSTKLEDWITLYKSCKFEK
ncbi:glycosyltransferase [Polaribacter sp. KT 15]|uniref:glycosyltransferase n=1 Tax=Polaribacter sp. KT 15 TaxID=1896175 RepID=UPI0009097B61|nr:glycosyltransferase [Polaribacter sp. KT 15]SHM86774.1 Glycosyltransferase involved in cell wall bisynthesis [Polaribacter sp. KT 15]